MKKKLITIVAFIFGLCLLLVPAVSDAIEHSRFNEIVSSYDETIVHLDEEKMNKMREEAVSWNKRLPDLNGQPELSKNMIDEYNATLNVDGDGLMGYISIPKTDCILPIFHGTDEDVLQNAVGHINGSSLPVGGESTHCILTGYRGLADATLFRDLDQLLEGDTFTISVLNEKYTYVVDQIRIVLPDEVKDLYIEEGKDYCTLETSTPYGVNSHRLLIRGTRVNEMTHIQNIQGDAEFVDPLRIIMFLMIPIIGISLTCTYVLSRKR